MRLERLRLVGVMESGDVRERERLKEERGERRVERGERREKVIRCFKFILIFIIIIS